MLKRLVILQILFLMVILTLNAQTKVMSIANKNGSLHNVKVSEADSLKFLTDYVEDIDGNVYKTVKIGDQWWMAENLRVTHYNNGTAIPYLSNDSHWSASTTGAYCCYDNDVNKVKSYGCLYNWYAVNTGKLAPTGWRVPTKEDWETLEQCIAEEYGYNKIQNSYDYENVGKHLKSTTGWSSGKNGTDDYGFNALPAGYRTNFGSFTNIGLDNYLWSATPYYSDPTTSWYKYVNIHSDNILWNERENKYGMSIRCIKIPGI